VRLAGFAADQAGYIKRRLGLTSDSELAQVNVIKLAEETGEAANAFLALRGLQRDAKLDGSPPERLEAMAEEIGDVVATVAVLAHALGLDFDEVIATRVRQLSERRLRWMETHESPDQ
jgi:NTP pyrophosphatase (non-canonical NTP hydrolase)